MAEARAAISGQAAGQARTSVVRRLFGRDWWLSGLLVAPVVLLLLARLVYPFIDAILLSFKDQFLGQVGTWVGVQNYVRLLSEPDSKFPKAAWNTIAITGSAIVGKLVIGMAMACVLNQRLRLRNLWRGLMFLPWCVPAVVTAYAWRFLFDTSGAINGMIAQYGWRQDYIYFFNDARIALPALILVIIWSGTPFWTMNFVAGMQAIPQEMYEAAEIDGANTFQR